MDIMNEIEQKQIYADLITAFKNEIVIDTKGYFLVETVILYPNTIIRDNKILLKRHIKDFKKSNSNKLIIIKKKVKKN